MGKTTTRSDVLDEATLEALKLSPEVAWYLQDRGYPLPEIPPKFKTPEPREVEGAQFDPERVDKVLKTFHLLRHTQGKWAGKPLDPDPWQIAYVIAPVFGWVQWDEDALAMVRIIRDVMVDVPRKNGKSTLAGGIAVYMTGADGESGGQVVTAASTERQAGFVFGPIKQLVEKTPALAGRFKAHQKRIVHPKSGSYIEVISSAADAQHGANLHCFIVDELHVHKSPDLVRTLETGRGSRTQPLGVRITTPDASKSGTIYDETRLYVEKLAAGTIEDHSWYGAIWGADEADDPFAPETQRKANPGYGISPSRKYLDAAALKAKNSPAELGDFLRLHLGIRTKQEARFLTLDSWDRNAGKVDEAKLKGRKAFGGWDLASASDLTAWVLLFPDGNGYDVLARFWIPEGALDALNKRTAGNASAWVRQGFLRTTPGNVTDYAFVQAQIQADLDQFDVVSIGFDPWNSTQMVNSLQDSGVKNLVRVYQDFRRLSPPLKELQRLLLTGSEEKPLFRTGGNPVLRWNVDNLSVDIDANGNVKPNKAHSMDKIDGVAATVNALSEALVTKPKKKNPYNDPDASVFGTSEVA
ncbi:phage terminase large subunit-like protein [Curtobacterium sp. PhB172]|uniref:terminase large subunit n=1 Tax=Curtobacterium sp. PhB172 TaxID=2485196 RepID=UPI000F4B0FE5|nr:terminase TerL endonuclease subunit [Curtobacterium sp. PhB172]ROS63900.1 phage terminase large subunit-like protein [Curtobacterium sp. PhB172]